MTAAAPAPAEGTHDAVTAAMLRHRRLLTTLVLVGVALVSFTLVVTLLRARTQPWLGLQTARAGRRISQEAVQLHGGIGVTDEYAIGHYASRLTALNHWLGDAREQVSVLSGTLGQHGVLDPLEV